MCNFGVENSLIVTINKKDVFENNFSKNFQFENFEIIEI